jgi:hypothetical protein
MVWLIGSSFHCDRLMALALSGSAAAPAETRSAVGVTRTTSSAVLWLGFLAAERMPCLQWVAEADLCAGGVMCAMTRQAPSAVSLCLVDVCLIIVFLLVDFERCDCSLRE